MLEKICFSDFKAFFEENIDRRSRTAKGVSDTSTSAKKQKLLKIGEDLVWQVKKNTERLVESVWESCTLNPINPNRIKFLDEQWNNIINGDLVPKNAYQKEYEALEEMATRIGNAITKKIDRRYRIWTVDYTSLCLSPLEIDLSMNTFYQELMVKIEDARKGLFEKEELLAYADYTIDKAIHPWRDGCGRSATAMVMWLSLLIPNDTRLPLFGQRDVHHRSMKDLLAHTDYFCRCLNHEFQ